MKNTKQKYNERETKQAVAGFIVVAMFILFILCIFDLLYNINNETTDMYGNTCRGNIVKVCSGDVHE